MKNIVATTLASLVFAGSAMAADGLKIESEAQFARDYEDRIEQIGPGLYLIFNGELTGKTVSIGEAGLAYDIDIQRERLTGSSRGKAQVWTLIRPMEGVRARYKQLHARQAINATVRKAASGFFPGGYSNFAGKQNFYSGYAQVNAITELYLDNGGGGLNPCYARASASASGTVVRLPTVPVGVAVLASARAENPNTGDVIQRNGQGNTTATASTSHVYSGAAFSHNLYAIATVSGTGYVSISDSM